MYADAFGSKRGPTPWQLIEAYKSLIFACVEINFHATVRVPLRLYSASGAGKPKPRSACEPRPISRSRYRQLRNNQAVARLMGNAGIEDVREITKHPILDTLDNPTGTDEDDQDYFDRPGFLGILVRYTDVVGLAYIKPEGGEGKPPSLLWPLQSQYVWPVRETNSARIKEYQYFTEVYPKKALLRMRLRASSCHPDGAGYAAAQAAWQYAGLEDKFVSIQDQLLGLGARPNLVFSPKDPMMTVGEEDASGLKAN